VVLEKVGEDPMDRSGEKSSMTQRQAGREYPTFSRKKAKWTGHMLRRNCLLKHVIEGNKEGRMGATGRQGRRRNQPVDELTVKRGY